MRRRTLRPAALAAALLILAPTAAAYADPPSWAPAHGRRDKHEKHEGKHKHDHKRDHRHDRGDDRVVIFHDRAPAAPWQSFYGLPVGLETGRCDAGLVGANLGTLLGGLAGGLGGSQIGKGDGRIAATIGGVLLGAVVGNALERSLSPVDEGCMAQTLERAPSGQQVVWNNPDSGAQYEMVPTRTYETAGGYCREYEAKAMVGNRLETVTGTACRQPDGAWKIMN